VIVNINPAGEGRYAITVDGVNADGKPIAVSYTFKNDGTPASVTGSPVIDTIMITKIDDHNSDRTSRKSGKDVGKARITRSPDGQTFIEAGTGVDQKGEKVKFSNVFEKQ